MNVKLLTNIDYKYNEFLVSQAKKTKTTKRNILEQALEIYIQYLQKQEIEKQYQKMADDQQYIDETLENSKYL